MLETLLVCSYSIVHFWCDPRPLHYDLILLVARPVYCSPLSPLLLSEKLPAWLLVGPPGYSTIMDLSC